MRNKNEEVPSDHSTLRNQMWTPYLRQDKYRTPMQWADIKQVLRDTSQVLVQPICFQLNQDIAPFVYRLPI